MAIVELSTQMRQLKEKIDELGEQKSTLQKAYDELRFRDIPKAMEEEGVEKITVSGVGTVYLEGGVDVSIPADVRDEAYQYIEEQLGDGEIIKPFIQTSTLKAWGKGKILDGIELPEHLFKVRTYQMAKILRR